jgi:YXWGXW repeat-containing protein
MASSQRPHDKESGMATARPIEHALRDPRSIFKQPSEVLVRADLDDARKRRILERGRHDAILRGSGRLQPNPLRRLALIAALLPLLGACEETVRVREPGIGAVVEEGGPIVVRERPPVLREEVIPAPPGERFVWRPGYWMWRNGWAWVPGRYVERPHPEAVWVPGHWAERRWGWTWVPGHWM